MALFRNTRNDIAIFAQPIALVEQYCLGTDRVTLSHTARFGAERACVSRAKLCFSPTGFRKRGASWTQDVPEITRSRCKSRTRNEFAFVSSVGHVLSAPRATSRAHGAAFRPNDNLSRPTTNGPGPATDAAEKLSFLRFGNEIRTQFHFPNEIGPRRTSLKPAQDSRTLAWR